MGEKEEKTPEPEKEHKVRNFLSKHRTKIVLGGSAGVAAALTAVIFKKSRDMDELYRFIEDRNLTNEFLGIETTPEV